MKKDEIGIIGLGKMGGNIGLHALEKGIKVVGYSLKPHDDFQKAGGLQINSLKDFKEKLASPRKIFIYVPAGPVVDETIDSLSSFLDKGDIILDGGNSYWHDSIERQKKLAQKNIRFIDLGTSGGMEGARHGACFMAGGEKEAIALVEPVLKTLATENGYVHAGPPGSGHFTKLVHNGIEFGMLQAIGEGMDLLENFPTKLNISAVLKVWRHGSVIRSWLIDLMEEAYTQEKGMEKIPAYVEDTGEVNWLINDAIQLEVPIPVLSLAVMQLFASRDQTKLWAKAIAMMRHGFGGHPYGPDKNIEKERREGRVGEFFRVNLEKCSHENSRSQKT